MNDSISADVIDDVIYNLTSGDCANVSVSDADLFERTVFDAIDLYVTPIWYILGVPGNILAFVVWIQRRMRPSSGYFLAALALDECIFLIMQVYMQLID